MLGRSTFRCEAFLSRLLELCICADTFEISADDSKVRRVNGCKMEVEATYTLEHPLDEVALWRHPLMQALTVPLGEAALEVCACTASAAVESRAIILTLEIML